MEHEEGNVERINRSNEQTVLTEERSSYEKLVRRYYAQLTVGCGVATCTTRMCASNRATPRLASQAAAIMAVQLASQPHSNSLLPKNFCPRMDKNISDSKSNIEVAIETRIQSIQQSQPLFLDSLLASKAPFQMSRSASHSAFPAPTTALLNRVRSSRLALLSIKASPLSPIPASGESSLENSQYEQITSPVDSPTQSDASVEPQNQLHQRQQQQQQQLSHDPSVLSSGLKALSKIGADASASFNSRAKSLMDLPSIFSASIGLPIFSSPASSPAARSPQNSATKPIKPSDKLLTSVSMSSRSSTSSLFEELDTEVISNHLDLSILETCLININTDNDITLNLRNDDTINKHLLSLLKTVRMVFSNAEALSNSFLKPGFNSSSNGVGIDVASLKKSFKIILDCEPRERFHHTLLNALEVLLSHIQLNIKRYQDGSHKMLRVLLILLENPFLHDENQNGRTLTKTAYIFGALKSKSRNVLIQWLSMYTTSEFSPLQTPFSTYVTNHVSSLHRPDETLISCIKTLHVLSSANQVPSIPIIPQSQFYNEALCRKLNFKEEYKIWMQGHTNTTTPKPQISGNSSSSSSSSTNSPLPPTPALSATTPFSYLTYSFLFDPVAKTRVMHIDAMSQMSLQYEEAVVHQAIVIHAQRFLRDDSGTVKDLEEGLKRETNPYLVLEIRRQHLVKDVLDQIHKQKNDSDLKKPLKVKFVGGGEEGMDQGGVQKEFFQVLVSMLVDPVVGMFVYDPETRYSWINGASLEPERQFELVGVVLGLALYNGVMLGIGLVPALYKKLLGERIGIEDLIVGFPTLGKGLKMLVDWNERDEYVDLYVQHYLEESVKRQFNAFKRGFHRVCGGPALKMCRADELEMMICGTNQLDFSELEAGAKYDDGYDPDHLVIKNFWSIVHGMTFERKKMLLMFVTASDRVPLKGLGNLVFVIQRNGPDTERLPTALTCFGRLLLPEYSSVEKLENRLVTAIENAKGFGLV
ncbi:hypothetical protein HK100_000475 [Physocladia obscura]|uniref:HECT-type E3 ubiquitin transferase n=1 Tax=Physocladia obscura TaxID=109957 RepID=A0AAD5XFK3_9FUNG|nr:hypothetical protein HK100_000475 [Physocladia obscura]